MARAREVSGLDCEDSFAETAARVVEVRTAEVFEHSEGVLEIGDIERVHDMRVASRRLLATLEVFAPCFPRKRHRKALKQVRRLADALGERRDRDVAIEFLEALEDETHEEDRPGLAALIERLREEQAGANEDLRPYVATKRLKKLRRRLNKLVGKAKA